MIKTFENFEKEDSGNNQSASERLEVQKDLYHTFMNKIQEIVDKNLSNINNPDWGDVGSYAHINENLLDIIEGWDEKFSEEYRKLL